MRSEGKEVDSLRGCLVMELSPPGDNHLGSSLIGPGVRSLLCLVFLWVQSRR